MGSPSGLSTENVVFGDKWAGYRHLSSAAGLSCSVYPCLAAQYSKPNVHSSSPGFTNYATGNYSLATGSAAIDVGSNLTHVTSVGTGNTFTVDDAYFFQDGRGIPNVQADWIAVGTVGNTAQISSINYTNKTITVLNANFSRAVNDKVWLYKKSDGQQVLYGAAPDIGALEKVPSAVTPVANFTCSPLNARLPSNNVVNCTDSSSNSPTSWAWTFGNGGTSTLQNPSRTYATAGTYTVALTATNASGNNTLTRSAYVKVSQTLFTTQTPTYPDYTDNDNYELGLKFRSTVAGKIIAIRHWKSPSETGAHVGRIWGSTGTQLATVTFTGETASGWQEQLLTTPLNIAANTTYVVSVNINSRFPFSSQNPTPSTITNGFLSATFDNANAAIGYDPGLFPSNSSGGMNYFRDVVFLPN